MRGRSERSRRNVDQIRTERTQKDGLLANYRIGDWAGRTLCFKPWARSVSSWSLDRCLATKSVHQTGQVTSDRPVDQGSEIRLRMFEIQINAEVGNNTSNGMIDRRGRSPVARRGRASVQPVSTRCRCPTSPSRYGPLDNRAFRVELERIRGTVRSPRPDLTGRDAPGLGRSDLAGGVREHADAVERSREFQLVARELE